MPKTKETLAHWPPSIANWLAFEKKEPWLATDEYLLYTDTWIIGETKAGPYDFMNTVASKAGTVRPAVVLRYAVHKAFEFPDFQKTNAKLYHGGSPQQELAALASLAMGIRLRAGRSTRRFEPNGDPLGRPTELGERIVPYFQLPSSLNLPSAAEGQHPVAALDVLNCLPDLSLREASAIVRVARLYQDALWLAESEPEISWLLLVSALETAANEWQRKKGNPITRLQGTKPDLYNYLVSLKDDSILSKVAEYIADSLGITHKFVSFVLRFLPDPPQQRPPEWAQFKWEPDQLGNALKTIYGYRSKALHDGRPFPPPMCKAPRLDSSWHAPAERMIAQATSERAGVWLKKDIPMNLHLFEYIARNVLLKWWKDCAQKHHSMLTNHTQSLI
jgi:hypothetical protein